MDYRGRFPVPPCHRGRLKAAIQEVFADHFFKETNMKHLTISLLSVFLLPVLVGAHCEIPCGIYGDEGRFALLLENATTIEKSMNEINKLSGESEKNNNQIVRWVVNKEHHADQIRDIVAQYFLAQRITEPAEGDAAAAKAYTAKANSLAQNYTHGNEVQTNHGPEKRANLAGSHKRFSGTLQCEIEKPGRHRRPPALEHTLPVGAVPPCPPVIAA